MDQRLKAKMEAEAASLADALMQTTADRLTIPVYGAPTEEFGDAIKRACEERGLDPTRITLQRVEFAPPPHLDTQDEIETLLAERETLLSLLREVEWGANVGMHYYDESGCPVCQGEKPAPGEPPREVVGPGLTFHRGHAPDCRLAAALKP